MSPTQCRAARALLGWSPADLARAAGVSVFTVRAFEAGRIAGARRGVRLMQGALTGAGIEFAEEGDDVRLRHPAKNGG